MEFTYSNANCPLNDIIIYVGPERRIFYPHAAFLCQHSDYFIALCKNPWKESDSRIRKVELPETNANEFELLLDFIYEKRNGMILMSPSDFFSLFRMADRFGCRKLLTKCSDSLCSNNFSIDLLELDPAKQHPKIWNLVPDHLMGIFMKTDEMRTILKDHSSDTLIAIIETLLHPVFRNNRLHGVLSGFQDADIPSPERFAKQLLGLFLPTKDEELNKKIKQVQELCTETETGSTKKRKIAVY